MPSFQDLKGFNIKYSKNLLRSWNSCQFESWWWKNDWVLTCEKKIEKPMEDYHIHSLSRGNSLSVKVKLSVIIWFSEMLKFENKNTLIFPLPQSRCIWAYVSIVRYRLQIFTVLKCTVPFCSQVFFTCYIF